MAVPTDMDGFSEKIASTDTYSRLALGDALLNYLGNNINSIECNDIGQFIDKLVPWLTCSNFKVAQKGLEIMTALIERMKNDFKPYVPTVCPAIVDRLGDGHESVREKAQAVLMIILEKEVLTPQQLFDRLNCSFTHKNFKVREEIMICLINTVNLYGSNSIGLSKLTPHLVKLLADQNIHVREQAFNTLIEIYRHVGDRLRLDIQKKYASTINPSRLAPLMAKMEELRDSGAVLPTSNTEGKYEDETDRQRSATKKIGSTKKPPVAHFSSSTSLVPGAVDEEYFLNAFEDVPTVQIFSSHELKEMVNSIVTIIGNQDVDWDRRVEAFKRIRSLLIAGAANFDDFNELMKKWEVPFVESLKDLRSHVVRETCVTIAYLAQTLGLKFGRFAEMIFPSLTALIQSSAKVIASAACTAIRFIIQNVHHQRLLPIINQNLSSKSKEIRKAMCDVLDQLIHTWPLSILDRRIPLLQEAVRKGVSDADVDARISARRAYWAFKGYFPEQAEALLLTLDYTYKRNLYSEASLSGSNQSLNQSSNSRQTASSTRVRGAAAGVSGEKKIISPGNRSNSAIDLQAAQRANARAQYAALNRLKAGSGASLPRSRKSPEAGTILSPERTSRPRSRVSGYSQSQPTSRSASPSSQLSYHTYQSPTSRPRKLSGSGISGIPGPRSSANSRETSRETSPTRHGSFAKLRSTRGTPHMSFDRPPTSVKPVLTQKILQQSREAESALADALKFDDVHVESNRVISSRRGCKLFDDQSDDSETSSVCSERSFDSLRRFSDDITEIIANCSRSSWSERKEGLVNLHQYLQNGNLLTPLELKRVTEIFTKMFMDSQTKVFTLFLDTLNEIIIKHQADLNDWLYVLLTKLLNKLGSDVLTSIGRKIQNTLTLVRENFSAELQMNEILRFIIDPTQTHNSKVKVAALTYLAQLASDMEPSDFNPGGGGGRDPTASALAKMINWTKSGDAKGTGEVKRASQEAIIALFNLNPSVITMKLAELSKDHQELAANLVQSHLRHFSTSGNGVSSTPAGMPLSPTRPPLSSLRNSHYDGDTVDSDEIYKSLRRTTAEIQNYSFESKLVERDRDTTSQDSGISQMSVGTGDKTETLEERLETFSLVGNNSGHSSSLSSPTQRVSLREYNGMEKTLTSDSLDEPDAYQEGNPEEEAEAWKTVLQTLTSTENDSLTSQQKEALTMLYRLVRQGSTLTLTQNFRKLFKILVQLLPFIDSNQTNKVISDVAVIIQVLRIVTEMFKKPALTPLFADFTELLLMKVMRLFEGAHKENKEVVKHAEICCSAMATVLPVDTTLKMLNAFAHTKDHPVNMYAVKTITKVVQHRNKELVLPHLKTTMTALIEAYNSEHSSVRKSVVFCIVALHSVFGEDELTPYLEKLCPSKRKLLNLYIKRQQHGTSACANESKDKESTTNE